MQSILHSETERDGLRLESDYTIDGTPYVTVTAGDETFKFIRNGNTLDNIRYQNGALEDIPSSVISTLEDEGFTVTPGL